MKIPRWVFVECEKLGFCKRDGAFLVWDKAMNQAWMIYRMILADRNRRKSNAGLEPARKEG